MRYKINPVFTFVATSLFLFAPFGGTLVAQEGASDENSNPSQSINYVDRTRKKAGEMQLSASHGSAVVDTRKGKVDSMIDSVIWVDTYVMSTNGRPWMPVVTKAKKGIALAAPATELAKVMAEQIKREREAEAAKKKKTEHPKYFAGGFCVFPESITISKANNFAELDCMLDFGKGEFRPVKTFIGIYPDYKREVLIGLPIYATFENGKRANFSGVVLNERKTSINIADWVDNARIRKLLGEGALATNDIAYRYASAYMTALNESRRKENVNYVHTTDANGDDIVTPVKTTDVEKPHVSDYLIAAGIEVVSKLFSIAGKDYLYNAEPLFAIGRGKRVYVEGVVSFDEKGLAHKFGLIEHDQQVEAQKNNEQWEMRKENIINQYGQQTTGGTGTIVK